MNNRKRRVADAAQQLFVKNGIQQTSIQDIIEKANISKGTFYNYFSSKADCIAEILEGLRYDASQLRMEMQIGKDEKDRETFVDQIAVLMQLNEERNLSVLFEAILNSNEIELKKLVLQHRLHEMEWLSSRFIDVYGPHIHEYAFEATLLFFGMMQHILFALRTTNMPYTTRQIVSVILSYMDLIIPKMIEDNCKMLDDAAIHLLRSKIDRTAITKQQLLDQAELIKHESNFTQEQQDLFDAIVSELQQERIRKSVLKPLLKPCLLAFAMTPQESQVHTFTNMIWYYMKMI